MLQPFRKKGIEDDRLYVACLFISFLLQGSDPQFLGREGLS